MDTDPIPPESPLLMSRSFDLGNGQTTDDLTLALASFSRGQTPEPVALLTCCCGRGECDHTQAWLAIKNKLEERLTLCAEVGQALLQKHEAYVRQHEGLRGPPHGIPTEGSEYGDAESSADARVAELTLENAALEKRLAQALVNAEVTEASNSTLGQELSEARATITRLTAHHARAVGWDTRLRAAMQDKDDLQQERDSESQRARMAEQRVVALKDRCSKLQAEMQKLEKDLQQQRQHRLELTEDVLSDARARLEMLQHAQLGHSVPADDSEVTKVLETLVVDNEDLKRNNAELQNLLGESREDVHALNEELDELRAAVAAKPPPVSAERPHYRHRYSNSVASSVFSDLSAGLASTVAVGGAPAISAPLTPRSLPGQHPGSARDPTSPEYYRRPLSPASSVVPSEMKWTAFAQPHDGRTPPSEGEEGNDQPGDLNARTERRRSIRPLILLTRERGVQTDAWSGLLTPGLPSAPAYSDRVSSVSPGEGPSESSSLAESNQSAVMSSLLERATTLLHRLTQADALTLSNRLKRQHLGGTEMVAHLSRTTVDAIVHDATALRTHYRSLLEDEKVTTSCTRRDLRVLFKLLKEAFTEMGQMRVTLNEVILEPAIAPKMSEAAMNPSKAEGGDAAKEAGFTAASLMAPISKLFGGPQLQEGGRRPTALMRSSSRGRGSALRPPARLVPKSGPALSATGTTVNVEFSGTGVGRAVSKSLRQDPEVASPSASTSRSVMEIFAGAPRPEADPWVVIPKTERPTRIRVPPNSQRASEATTIGRSTMRPSNRLSRNVDAVIDNAAPTFSPEADEDGDFHPRLLERTLRPRGLSDSSIHSTFVQHGDQPAPVTTQDGPPRRETWQDRQSMFQAFGRKIQSFGFGSVTAEAAVPPSAQSRKRDRGTGTSAEPPVPGLAALLPSLNIGNWAGGGVDVDIPDSPSHPRRIGSPADDSNMHRTWMRETQRRDADI